MRERAGTVQSDYMELVTGAVWPSRVISLAFGRSRWEVKGPLHYCRLKALARTDFGYFFGVIIHHWECAEHRGQRSTAMVSTIAEAVEVCSVSFSGLHKALQSAKSDSRSQIPLTCVTDQHGRFNVWAGNIGAHQHGRSSLDHRLRDASQIREEFVKVLQYLKETLDDGKGPS